MKVNVNNREYDLDQLNITGNTQAEQEITVTASANERVIHVYTSRDAYFTRIKKLIAANPEGWNLTNIIFRSDGTISGVMAEGPKKGFGLRTALPVKRGASTEDVDDLSDENDVE